MVSPLLHSKLLQIVIASYRNYSKAILNTSPIMEKNNYAGKSLQDIITQLTKYAPLKLAESWDNVGLLVDPMESASIKKIVLTNDLTEDVVDEAVNVNAGLIISYHPNIFQPLKSVTSRSWKERIVVKCIKHNIAVFSPHTSWDSVNGGVNDWLSNAFDVKLSLPIIVNEENSENGAGRICRLTNPLSLEEIIKNIKTHIGIPHLRLAIAKGKNQKSLVSSIALCAGSGSSVLRDVEADLYLTGEMLHHDILDATQKGIHVILCNHSDSERGFLKVFRCTLYHSFLNKEVEVLVSEADRDPLVTV